MHCFDEAATIAVAATIIKAGRYMHKKIDDEGVIAGMMTLNTLLTMTMTTMMTMMMMMMIIMLTMKIIMMTIMMILEP